MERRIFIGWAVLSVGVMVAGGFGPWSRVLNVVTTNGTDGDGWIVIGAGLVALALVALHARFKTNVASLLVALLAALIAAATAIYDWTDLHRVSNETIGLIHPGWGIYLASIGSVSLAASCVALIVTVPAKVDLPVATTPHSG